MKILHVIGEIGYGGAEVVTAQLAVRLAALGHQVEVLAFGFCDAEMVAELRKKGVAVLQASASLKSPVNAIRLRSVIRRFRPDVVHSHLFPALYLGAFVRAFSPAGIIWVYTEHSTSNGRRSRRWLRPLECWVYRRFDAIICVSTEVGSALKQWVGNVRPALIPNGIDVAKFVEAVPLDRASLGIAAEGIIVMMVGAFRPEKNHARLIEAFALLPMDHVLVLAGDGRERGPVEECVMRSGLQSRVHFLGTRPDAERLYQMADVYVLPSRFEGFGISALEAAAAGLPIVHSDVPGLAEMLDGAGWPVDPENAESIAGGIMQAGKAGRSSAKAGRGTLIAGRHGLDATLAAHVELYRSLVSTSRGVLPRTAGPPGGAS